MTMIFIVMGAFFTIIGIGAAIGGFVSAKALGKSREVTATVVDVVSRKERRKRGPCRVVYSPVYEYYDGGEYKKYKSSMSSTFEVKLGTETTLYISEDGRVREKGASAFMFVFGAVFAFVGIICIAAGMVFRL